MSKTKNQRKNMNTSNTTPVTTPAVDETKNDINVQNTEENTNTTPTTQEENNVGETNAGDTAPVKDGNSTDPVESTEDEAGQSTTPTTDTTAPDAGAVVEETVATQTTTETVTQEPTIGVVVTQQEETVPVEFDFKGINFSDELKQIIVKTAKLDDYCGNVLRDLVFYMTEMRPGKQMDETDGGKNQAFFYRTLRYLFTNANDNFELLYSTVLAIINEFKTDKTVFNERYVFRFMNSIQVNDSESDAFSKWVNMLLVTSDVKDRKNMLSHVNITKSIAGNMPEDSQNRIIKFYNL